MRHVRLSEHPRRALEAAWPSIRAAWLLMIPTAPAMALMFELIRVKSLDEKAAAEERRKERALGWRSRAARRRARKLGASLVAADAVQGRGDDQALMLGPIADGDW